MMRIIAVVNQKGGSGKTTTTVNLAATLAEKQRRVLIVDLDPQASATNWYAVTDAGRDLYQLFTDGAALASIIRPTQIDRVSLVPASAWLVGVERALAAEPGAEGILKQSLKGLSSFDYILFDCPPSLGTLTVNALNAAREILVPVAAEYLAVEGLAQLRKTINTVRARLNPALTYAGIVACRVDRRTRHALEVVELLRKSYPNAVYRTAIHENVRLSECPAHGEPITLYDTTCTGAADYRALAVEVMTQETK